jgi:protein-histidine N-methyltransferase
LGAGTAVPSLALFASLLSHTSGSEQRETTHFTFADYNASVLRLVTLPNLLLTWHNSRAQPDPESQPQQTQEELELEITPELITEFRNDLTQRRITISFISGAWSPEFVDLVCSAKNLNGDQKRHTLILASETIYSPSSLGAFSETLLDLLRRASSASTSTAQTRALVAAKKVYFGVGGGVDEFLAVLADTCPDGLDVQQKLDVQSEGVGRVVLEIGLANH